MAKLSDSEQELLDKLTRKREAPDAPPVNKSISANIDLSDDKQVALAIKHGFLTAEEVKEEKEKADDKEGDKGKRRDATPRRRGSYFKEDDDE